MSKIDFKKSLRHLYSSTAKEFEIVDVPEMQFIRIDGLGSPDSEQYGTAIEWLYSASYPIKFISKEENDRDYVVPPLEGLWWADDMDAYTRGERDSWKWTMMIMQPDWVTPEMYQAGLDKAAKKLGSVPESLRFESFAEGQSVQILHVGPYSEEAPTIARLHNEYLPSNGLIENGHHHEIYLGDPRRTAPEKLKTILRQPVRGDA